MSANENDMGGAPEGQGDSMAMAKAEGASLLEGLMDFGFTKFITKKIIKVLYGLGIACILLFAVIALFSALAGLANGVVLPSLIMIILLPFIVVLQIIGLRVGLELTIIVFNIADNTKKIADRG